jgi:CelD/BcsL family acetyltransferase involved in cellulose biosynthesis
VTGLSLELIQDFEQLRGDWVRLALASGNIFSTWEWNTLWWDRFGQGRRLLTFALRDGDGAVSAIVPLYAWRDRPLRVLRFLGHGHGDLLGPVCPREDLDTAVEALQRALRGVRHDVFVGDWLIAEHDWSTALSGRILREDGYPILRFEVDSWEDYLASRGRKFRKSVGSERRRLEREHDVRFRLTSDPANLEADLDSLFALHRARFGPHGDCYFCGSDEPFQREFAALALDRGWLRMWLLEVDGKPVAADYGFRFADVHFAYQLGRDPEWERASVGSILEAFTIRNALEERVAEYRFLLGNEPYKYRYANEDPELETIGAAGSAVGRLALNGVAALRHVRPFAKLAKRAAGG